ncbi:MAG: Lipopolysaccharide export system permease protein LptG [Syntrophus sp. PtaU1.Bin208]|nr:MAG: Lipopolysaccharide export system permease protein LptG [Syntrophus sp. PtaU1.Bin208]
MQISQLPLNYNKKMKRLDFYIGGTFLKCFSLVLIILAVLFSCIEFLSELDEVGKGLYGLGNAAIFVIFTLPKCLIDLMPFSAMLGGVIALGLLADHGELIAMQAAGISTPRICAAVFAAVMLIVLAFGIMAETIMPQMEQAARRSRAQAIYGPGVNLTKQGFWARRQNSFIHVHKISSEGIAAGVDIFEFDPQGRLKTFTHAQSANIRNSRLWTMKGVTRKVPTGQGISIRKEATGSMEAFLNMEQVAVLESPPYSLSTPDLRDYISALQNSGQDADPYLLALWRKLGVPLTTGAMALFSLSFVFGIRHNRVSAGHRITLATLIGFGLYFSDQVIMHTGLLLNLNPLLTAMIPPVCISALALWRLRILY